MLSLISILLPIKRYSLCACPFDELMHGYLAKPIRPLELDQLLANHMARRMDFPRLQLLMKQINSQPSAPRRHISVAICLIGSLTRCDDPL